MRPMGVTTKKNIIPMTIGEIIFPKNIPNLNQILLSGDKILESKIPKIKNIIEITKDHILILSLFNRG